LLSIAYERIWYGPRWCTKQIPAVAGNCLVQAASITRPVSSILLSAYPKSGCGANTGAVSRDFSDSLLVQAASITRPVSSILLNAKYVGWGLCPTKINGIGGAQAPPYILVVDSIWPRIYRGLYLVHPTILPTLSFCSASVDHACHIDQVTLAGWT
jgi:hypothetical protein